ncbi:unnamed protein product [Mytilus coruscus]|uniref:Ig-like domain-containing protein n=1 Tax=Mytilus coruscus TaxID=42192 RepID=A0A6J8AY05_MYTCO|nr:unnamed protein product [Mytilus coruscus]
MIEAEFMVISIETKYIVMYSVTKAIFKLAFIWMGQGHFLYIVSAGLTEKVTEGTNVTISYAPTVFIQLINETLHCITCDGKPSATVVSLKWELQKLNGDHPTNVLGTSDEMLNLKNFQQDDTFYLQNGNYICTVTYAQNNTTNISKLQSSISVEMEGEYNNTKTDLYNTLLDYTKTYEQSFSTGNYYLSYWNRVETFPEFLTKVSSELENELRAQFVSQDGGYQYSQNSATCDTSLSLSWNTLFIQSCDDAVEKRLKTYSIISFVFKAINILAEVL